MAVNIFGSGQDLVMNSNGWALEGNTLLADGTIGTLNDYSFTLVRNGVPQMTFFGHQTLTYKSLYLDSANGGYMGMLSVPPNKEFGLFIGNNRNMISWKNVANHPLRFLSSSGFSFIVTRFLVLTMSGSVIQAHKNIDMMTTNKIVNLPAPVNATDCVTKAYCDLKVSKTGDTMTGNLYFDGSNSHIHTGCNNLSAAHIFKLYLGSESNSITADMSNIDIFGTRTIAVSVGTVLNIITINSAEIVITKPLSMANCNICNVATPLNATDAVNKAYVDAKVIKKCYSGYIPLLEANRSMLGYNANASSIVTSNYAPYKAFNNFEEAWVASDTTGWLQIECPEAVTIWKVALKARAHSERNIMAWNIAGSNDESTFTTLLTSTNALLGAATSPSFFNIETTTAYKFYRFNITSYIGSPDVGVAVMQLYVLTD